MNEDMSTDVPVVFDEQRDLTQLEEVRVADFHGPEEQQEVAQPQMDEELPMDDSLENTLITVGDSPKLQPTPDATSAADRVKTRTSRKRKDPLVVHEKPVRKSVTKKLLKVARVDAEPVKVRKSKKSAAPLVQQPADMQPVDVSTVHDEAKPAKVRKPRKSLAPVVGEVLELQTDMQTMVAPIVEQPIDMQSLHAEAKPTKVRKPKKFVAPIVAEVVEQLVDMQTAPAEPAIPVVRMKKRKLPYVWCPADIPPIDGLIIESTYCEFVETPAPKVKKTKVPQIVPESVEPPRNQQPSVLNFFLSKASPEKIIPSTPQNNTCLPVCEPNLESYLVKWKREGTARRKKSFEKKFTFVRKSQMGTVVVNYWEIPGKRPCRARRHVRPVFIAIHDRERPPVKFIMTYESGSVSGRRPRAADTALIDYERDSDEEWVEEHDGEDLGDEDEPEDPAELAESDADSFFVSDGHFSEDDALSEDEAVVAKRRSSGEERRPGTLQIIALSPADFVNGSSLPPHYQKWLNLVLSDAKITVFDHESYFKYVAPVAALKPKLTHIDRAELARFVHGKSVNIDSLVSEYKALHNADRLSGIKAEIRSMAAWTKGANGTRVAWTVKPELFDSLNITSDEMDKLLEERRKIVVAKPPKSASKPELLPFKPQNAEDVSNRAVLHN